MSAIVFPGLVIDLTWRDSAALPVGVAVDAYSAACAHWGERRPPSVAGINRLSALAERVIDSASASALPLFAASRAWPRPEGGGARAAAPGRAAGVAGAGLHFAALRGHGLDIPFAALADPGGGPGEAAPDCLAARGVRATATAR